MERHFAARRDSTRAPAMGYLARVIVLAWRRLYRTGAV